MDKLRTILVSAQQGWQKDERVRDQYFASRAAKLQEYAEAFLRMFEEPMILDDSWRHTQDWWQKFLIYQCEIFICKEGEKLIGFVILAPEKAGRSYQLLAWVTPEYRGGRDEQANNLAAGRKMLSFLRENIFPYAWEVLKLVRLETNCSVLNVKAIKYAKAMGFTECGIARLDFQIKGYLSDSVSLELLNPAFLVEPVEEIEHELRKQRQSDPEPSFTRDGRSEPEYGECIPGGAGWSDDDAVGSDLWSVPEVPSDNGEGWSEEPAVQRRDGGSGQEIPGYSVQSEHGTPAWRSRN